MWGGGAGWISVGFTECDDPHQLNLLRLDCHWDTVSHTQAGYYYPILSTLLISECSWVEGCKHKNKIFTKLQISKRVYKLNPRIDHVVSRSLLHNHREMLVELYLFKCMCMNALLHCFMHFNRSDWWKDKVQKQTFRDALTRFSLSGCPGYIHKLYFSQMKLHHRTDI